MELAITGWSFPHCTLEEAAGIAGVLGFEAMDVGAYPGGHLDRSAILGDQKPELQRIQDLGMKISNLYWTFGTGFAERALNSPDAAIRRQNTDDFRRVVDFCQAAGIPTIMVLPGILHPGQTRGGAIDTCMDACQDLVAISKPANIEIALEPHVGSVLESPDDTMQVATETPGVKLALDYGHFVTAGYTQSDVDALTCYAAHIHVRQAKPGFLQTRMEHGILNFPAIIDTLRCACYEGYLAIEYVHQDYLQTDNVDVISETVKMRDLLRRYVRIPGRGRGQAPCAS
jgi:sugar phosphate isomerase/epimerase